MTEETLLDLFKRADEAAIAAELVSAYQMKQADVDWHLDVARRLAVMPPEQPSEPMRIRVSRVTDPEEPESESWVDVSGLAADAEGTVYGISFMPWKHWLAMSITVVNADMTEAQILAHCVWEMTWHGEEDDRDEKMAEMIEQLAEIKEALADAEDDKPPKPS